MNPTSLSTYVDGLHKTLEEKLFFIDVLDKDFFNNKIVIDFGCGDGSVLEYIARNCKHRNAYFFGVDINKKMLEYAEEKLFAVPGAPSSFCCVLDRVLDSLKLIKENREVVFIATSVFHELDKKEQERVCDFISEHCDYFICRDMEVRFAPTFYYDNYLDLMSKIIANSNPKMLSQFVRKYGFGQEAALHYLLKYTYVENWETELEENYLSINWGKLRWCLDKVVYEKSYIQEWRANQVKKDFDIDLEKYTHCTHNNLITARVK